MHLLDGNCIVKSIAGRPTLDLDSLLCLEDRRLIGRVFETFGQVHDPLYSVLIASTVKTKPAKAAPAAEEKSKAKVPVEHSESAPTPLPADAEAKMESEAPTGQQQHSTAEHAAAVTVIEDTPAVAPTTITDSLVVEVSGSLLTESLLKPRLALLEDLKVGLEVFFVKSHSSFVHHERLYTKGYDASNEFDEEVPEEHLDFSDDEKELQAKRAKRKRNNKDENEEKDDALREEMEAEMADDPDKAAASPAPPRGRGNGRRVTPAPAAPQNDAMVQLQQLQAYAYQTYYAAYGAYSPMMMPGGYGYPMPYPYAMPGQYHPQYPAMPQQYPPMQGLPQYPPKQEPPPKK